MSYFKICGLLGHFDYECESKKNKRFQNSSRKLEANYYRKKNYYKFLHKKTKAI